MAFFVPATRIAALESVADSAKLEALLARKKLVSRTVTPRPTLSGSMLPSPKIGG